MLNKNVILLTLSQAFSMSSGAVIVLVGGLVGTTLAPTPVLATLPVAVMIIGVALSTIPASMIMKRVGRKAGFIGASTVATVASFLASLSIQYANFFLFCLSVAFIGSSLAFAQQYRFAAAESVGVEDSSRAISFILLGGIAAAVIGPSMANMGKDWTMVSYQGSFIALAVLTFIPAVLLVFYRENRLPSDEEAVAQRSIWQIVKTPGYLVAVMSGAVAYAVMSFIMTATPISMHHLDNHSFDNTTFVIQWHVIAMYLPSLVTGVLIKRWGVHTIMYLGSTAMVGCVLIALSGHSLINYWVALVLLGIGWNFLFVAGTAKLVLHYQPNERFKAQAVNDFTVFSIQATASLSAGWVLHELNWEIVNLVCLPILALMILVVWFEGRQAKQVLV